MANIAQMLAALANLPPVPTGGVGPLTPTFVPPSEPDFMTPMPEAPPAAPSMPLDRGVIEQYLSALGPAPTPPPAPAPIGGLERIALALQAFGAGFQGQGPQFLQSVRAERERPQREFEARMDDFNQRRQQFGLRGLEAARDIEDKRQARQQFEADRRYQTDLKRMERELDLKDDREKIMLQDLLLSRRQREDDERQATRQAQAEQARKQALATRLRAQFASPQGGAAPPAIAKALGDYYAELTDELPPAAAKWDAGQQRMTEIRARRGNSGTGGGSGGGAGLNGKAQKALTDFEAAKAAVADAVARGDTGAEQLARKRMNTTLTTLSRFPGQVQVDFSGALPTARVKTGKAAPAIAPGAPGGPEGPFVPPEMLPKQAAPVSMNRSQAKAKLIKGGYNSKEADAELDRLGIK